MKQSALIAGLIACMGLLNSANTASLYDLAEETVTWADHGLPNPFMDVELKLDIKAPSGRTLGADFEFRGFYDGDGQGGQSGSVWKYRILLDAPGAWTIKAKFVERGTDTPKAGAPAEKTFTYTVANTPAKTIEHGHVRVDKDHPRWFRFDDGTPFYPNPVHSSSMFHVPLPTGTKPSRTTNPVDMRNYIDKHVGYGVNAAGVRWHFEDKYRHFYTDQSTFRIFNLATWNDYEIGVKYAQSKLFYVYIWFGISGLNTQYSSYGPRPTNNTTLSAEQKLFIDYFLARFAAFTCWWHWTTDSEFEEGGSGALDRNVTYANYLRERNPWKTLVSAHSLRSWTPKENPAFNLATLQLKAIDDQMCIGANIVKANYYGRPVFNQEGIWKSHGVTTGNDLRIVSWAHFISGGHTHYAGSNAWGDCKSWDASMHQVRGAMSKLIKSRLSDPGMDFTLTEPANGLVALSGGHRAYCLAASGRFYLVWLSQGGNATVDLTGENSTFTVQRLKTADGSIVDLPDVAGGSKASLGATPDTGYGKDYLFILKNSGAAQLVISTAQLPEASVGKAYDVQLSTLNAKGSVTWSVATGALPGGLAISAGGRIAGTPTTTGTSNVTIKAQDSQTTAQRAFALTVTQADTTPPVVTNVGVKDVSASRMTVTWETSEPADSRVQWGDAPGNYTGESGVVETGKTSHSVTINGTFATGTKIYLLIISADQAGNAAVLERTYTAGDATIGARTSVRRSGNGQPIVTATREGLRIHGLDADAEVTICAPDGRALNKVTASASGDLGRQGAGLKIVKIRQRNTTTVVPCTGW